MRTHDAWLIDLDGTLYVPKPMKWAMAAELLLSGLAVVRVLRRFREQHELLRAERGTYEPSPFDEQVKRTAQDLNLSAEVVNNIVREWMIDRPCKWLSRFKRQSLMEEITAFRAEGGRTALVSDYPAHTKLAALGASNLFDRVIASGDPGGPKRLKPIPDGLLLAASALEVEPKRCLVVGDRADVDGAAASAASMEFRLVR
jgi:HAD superfamily hydrolase (TIGR01549 family)